VGGGGAHCCGLAIFTDLFEMGVFENIGNSRRAATSHIAPHQNSHTAQFFRFLPPPTRPKA